MRFRKQISLLNMKVWEERTMQMEYAFSKLHSWDIWKKKKEKHNFPVSPDASASSVWYKNKHQGAESPKYWVKLKEHRGKDVYTHCKISSENFKE